MTTWIRNHIRYKVWDEITYQFQTSTIAQIYELKSNFIPQFTGQLITYSCHD